MSHTGRGEEACDGGGTFQGQRQALELDGEDSQSHLKSFWGWGRCLRPPSLLCADDLG